MNNGGIVGAPSIRTYDYNAVYGTSSVALPKTFMLPEDRLPSVTNQGKYNACCAFAIAEVLQVLHRIEFGKDEQFSEGFIYGWHRLPEATYQGMNPDSSLKFLCKCGSVPKKYYNELYEMPEMREKLFGHPNFKEFEKIAEKYKLKGYVGFLKSNYEDMKRALYECQYPLFAVANKGFGSPHAIIVVGWDENGFIIQNSWGKDWGKNGLNSYPLSVVSYAYLFIDEVLELKFLDVNKSDWSYDAIKECVFNGLMQGMSETEFAPKQPVLRDQAAQLMVNKQRNDDAVNKIMADRMEDIAERLEKVISWARANGYKE